MECGLDEDPRAPDIAVVVSISGLDDPMTDGCEPDIAGIVVFDCVTDVAGMTAGIAVIVVFDGTTGVVGMTAGVAVVIALDCVPSASRSLVRIDVVTFPPSNAFSLDDTAESPDVVVFDWLWFDSGVAVKVPNSP